jgi:hypothetical protein
MREASTLGSQVVHGVALLSEVTLRDSDQAHLYASVKRKAHDILRQGLVQ